MGFDIFLWAVRDQTRTDPGGTRQLTLSHFAGVQGKAWCWFDTLYDSVRSSLPEETRTAWDYFCAMLVWNENASVQRPLPEPLRALAPDEVQELDSLSGFLWARHKEPLERALDEGVRGDRGLPEWFRTGADLLLFVDDLREVLRDAASQGDGLIIRSGRY